MNNETKQKYRVVFFLKKNNKSVFSKGFDEKNHADAFESGLKFNKVFAFAGRCNTLVEAEIFSTALSMDHEAIANDELSK